LLGEQTVPDYKHDLPTNYYFGGGDDGTYATPLAILVMLIAILLLSALPRKYAYVPFLIAALLVPLHVVLLIGSLHFNATRILILTGWLRVLIRRERFPGRLQLFDKIVLASALCSAVMYSLLWRDFGAVVNRTGVLMTTMGAYFLLRFLVRDQQDVVRVIKALAVVVIVIAPLMVYEYLSAYNPFWLLGAPQITNVRDGVIRAQGPFGHAITAGVIGAVLLPLFVGLYFHQPGMRRFSVAAIASATVMVLASHSSTPLLTYAAAVLGLAVWPLRKSMRKVRWGVAIVLLLAQVVLQSPIWFVMNRASGLMGGSGWHRAMLVDNFVRHFSDWWLVGTRANPDWGWSMWDVDNAYVGAGVTGGLLSFVLFIAMLVYAFKLIGRARKRVEKNPSELRLTWILGAALFANTVAFFGIVYFDQGIVAWYALLAMIAVVPTFVAATDLPRLHLEPDLGKVRAQIAVAGPAPHPHDREWEGLWS
jgi:hypothetical protein